MLNEERVKHMIKLADYETKGGNEEIIATCLYEEKRVYLEVVACEQALDFLYGKEEK